MAGLRKKKPSTDADKGFPPPRPRIDAVGAVAAFRRLGSDKSNKRAGSLGRTSLGRHVKNGRSDSNGEVRPKESADVQKEVRRLARASSFSFFGLTANAILTFIFMFMVSHSLSQLEAGAVFEAIAIFTTTSLIATGGANVGLMRSLPLYRRRSAKDVRRSVLVAIIPTLAIGVGIAIALFVEAPAIAVILVHKIAERPGATSQLKVLAPTIPAAAVVYVLTWGDRAWGILASVSVQYIFVPFVRIAVFLALAAVGMTAFRATIAWGVPFYFAMAIAVLITAWRLRIRSATLPGVIDSPEPLSFRTHISTFWRFAAPRSIEGILLVFLTGFDIILVGVLANSRAAAIYTIANRYILLCAFGLQAIIVAIPTRISDLMHTRRERQARQLYRVATWWTIGMCWPPAIVLAIYAPVFMGIFGQHYRSGSEALIILTIGIAVNSATGPGGAVLLMSGKSSANLLSTTIAVALNVPLNFLLIPKMGETGAAIAWTLSITASNIVQMYILWRTFRIHAFGRELFIITIMCLSIFGGLGAIARWTLGTSAGSLAIYAPATIIIYAIFLYWQRATLRVDSFAKILRGASAQ
jgi:O-antigen/teichoic acid export membrane protein